MIVGRIGALLAARKKKKENEARKGGYGLKKLKVLSKR